MREEIINGGERGKESKTKETAEDLHVLTDGGHPQEVTERTK